MATGHNRQSIFHAGNLMKAAMAHVGGGGGGSATFARGGCRADKVDEVFAFLRRHLEEQLKGE